MLAVVSLVSPETSMHMHWNFHLTLSAYHHLVRAQLEKNGIAEKEDVGLNCDWSINILLARSCWL